METQNFKNHIRFIPLYHGLTLFGILTVIIGSLINLVKADDLFLSSLIFAISLILASLAIYNRSFALKAQDKAIRAEENLRHFILSGKPLDKNLKIGQVIALRFASDEEFIPLAEKAAKENLSPKSIKMSIKNWKADYHRA